MRRKLAAVALAAVACAALVAGIVTLATDAQAGPCRCPMIYAPVQCDNGKTYSNQCLADCHRAKNCVPIGVLEP